MTIKQGLTLQLGQQLKMTPQLQQAIRLLQLSALDLRQEIQDTVEANPLLELEDLEQSDHEQPEVLDHSSQELDLDSSNEFQDDLQVDTEWADIYPESASSFQASGSDEDDGEGWEARSATSESLQDYLLWQLNLTPMSDGDRAIAYAIIESLDQRGYLSSDLDDLAEAVRRENPKPEDPAFPEADEMLAVLRRVQHFDPPGIAARDLAECLAIQLNLLAPETPWREEALTLVLHHLEQLEQQGLEPLQKKLGVTRADLDDIMRLIRSLQPFPGETLAPDNTAYVTPDVIVSRKRNRWVVELNSDALPKVSINEQYAGLLRDSRHESDGSYLRNQLQEARWFLKSLQSRNETLLKVATRIVEVQKGFFDYGEEAMKPLVLSDIASHVEMHESTISRVTNQKYMLTPKGVFELKYFFSSHVGTDAGGECSSTAIRAIIKKLVAAEDSRKPLSDNKLADLLNAQGIQVARRTVAKYREAMRIPASSDRKRLL